jgi:transcriptional regulator with XRE-family HTH domain
VRNDGAYFAEIIKTTRMQFGYSQKEAAAKCGLTPKTIRRRESGHMTEKKLFIMLRNYGAKYKKHLSIEVLGYPTRVMDL